MNPTELEDPLGLSQETAIVGMYGGPYERPPWEPEPVEALTDTVRQQPWELSAIIYDVFLLIILAGLVMGQLILLFRGVGRCIDYLSKRLFLGSRLADTAVDNWNKIHIARYTPSEVVYLKGPAENYKLHIEDYQELMRILKFVDEQSAT